MFKLFKTKIDKNIYAPISGKCIDITDVNDIAFSSKEMGDGIAIIPDDHIIKAPCNGVIEMIFRTNHALGIKADNGTELLIHIGIDTVNLNGKGFHALKSVHDKVKIGDPLIKFDYEDVKDYEMTTILVITNQKAFHKVKLNQAVNEKDCILEGIDTEIWN